MWKFPNLYDKLYTLVHKFNKFRKVVVCYEKKRI